MSLLGAFADFIWNPWLLFAFLLVGLYFSLRTGFFQILHLPFWWKCTAGSLFHRSTPRSVRGITQLQALSTALAATIGTGSIAGVATAIFWGGPGSVFWMWVSALLGMMTSCAEKTLAVYYRIPSPKGGWNGGPMYYMQFGMHSKAMASLFCILCILETLVGGNLVQSNSIASALEDCFGICHLPVGLIVAVLVGGVIFGGIRRIGRVSERLVPFMALLFMACGIIVLFVHRHTLPAVLRQIFTHAFAPKAALGGYGAAAAMRYGVARGVFTNEAGLGTSSIAHAAADVNHPAQQGMWGIFEVFVSTLVVCTTTAFVILSSGVYNVETALRSINTNCIHECMLGAPLSSAAFSTVFGDFGGIIVSICLILFAFTSLLGACYYGEQCIIFLTGSERIIPVYRLLFISFTIGGSVIDLTSAWILVDLTNGIMAIPNLITLLFLSSEAIHVVNQYRKKEIFTKPSHYFS